MSTNYYALWRVVPDADEIFVKLNIGNVSGGTTQFSTLSGVHFPDRATWVSFLQHNRDTVTIYDEYRVEQDIDEIIDRILCEEGASLRQTTWLIDHGYTVHPDAGSFKRWSTDTYNWLDGEQLFYGGEFS